MPRVTTPESSRYSHPPPPSDTYWGIHPFVVRAPVPDDSNDDGNSGLTQWYATSNSSFSDLRQTPPGGNDEAEWPTLSNADRMVPLSSPNVREGISCQWEKCPPLHELAWL